jgi:FAD/FMN-containing dehydrogenase
MTDVTIVRPGDDGWDDARRAWNLMADQRPAMVGLPESAAEVAELVSLARESGLRVTAQAEGHGAAALDPVGDDTLLIRTMRMADVEVDTGARRARVGAGAKWRDVVPQISEAGLAALSGSSPEVGIAGYTLGGGLGWFGRKHGLAAGQVEAIEVVTADGREVRASRDNEPDLFWALRGGGGSFGVVTAIEFGLIEVPELTAGMLVWPWQRAGEVLQAWREWIGTVPEELTSATRILQVPPFPEIPEPFRGKQFVIVQLAFLGPEDEGARLLEPLRALGPDMDTYGPVTPLELGGLAMDPEDPVPARGTHALLDGVTAETIDALVGVAGHESGSPLTAVELRHLGGAIGRPDPDAGALSSIPGELSLFVVGATPAPELDQAVQAHLGRLDEAVGPWKADNVYLNFMDTPTDAQIGYDADAYSRLCEIKRRYDPDNLLRGNHAISG